MNKFKKAYRVNYLLLAITQFNNVKKKVKTSSIFQKTGFKKIKHPLTTTKVR